MAFIAYCLRATLEAQLRQLAGSTISRTVIEKFAATQMVDVILPTTGGRELTLLRYKFPEAAPRRLLEKLWLRLQAKTAAEDHSKAGPARSANTGALVETYSLDAI